MQSQMLLRNQPGSDPRAKVGVQKLGDLSRADVLSTLQEAAREDRDGVCVCLDQVCHHLRELLLLLQGRYLPLLVREEGVEGM